MSIVLKSMAFVLSLILITGLQAMEEVKVEKNKPLLQKIAIIIAKDVVNDCLKSGQARKLPCVCKGWNESLNKENFACYKPMDFNLSFMEFCQMEIFLNGKLIYKPDPNSDVGMKVMCISDLMNPLEGTFDLSTCGDADQYLSINTGYCKGKRVENVNKVGIWFVPRVLIKKE